MIPGALITFISIGYSSLRIAASSHVGQMGLSEESEELPPTGEGQPLLAKHDSKSDADNEDQDVEANDNTFVNEAETLTYKWSFFHFVFCFASMYMLCVIVGWQILST